MDLGDCLHRIADQKGMGEMRQEFGRPDMVDILREILEEDRPFRGACLHILPHTLDRQAGRGCIALPEARPERILS